MKEVPILAFIDIETTGHDPLKSVRLQNGDVALTPWHEIIDLGCVFVRSDTLEVVGEFQTLVIAEYPERCIPDIINHYPRRLERGEWEDALPLPDALRDFFSACQTYGRGREVVPGGQNWFFDWSFLSVAFAFCGIDEEGWRKYLHYKKFDTSSMAVQACREPGTPLDMAQFSSRSGKLQAMLGLEPEPMPHDALNGAKQAFEVFRALDALKKGERK